jgi:hypothetical protein
VCTHAAQCRNRRSAMADAAAAHERAARGNRGQRYDSLHAALAGRGFLLQAARARSRISLKPFLRSRGPTLCESPCPEACKAHMRVDVAAQARLLRWLTQGCSPRAQPIIEPVGVLQDARAHGGRRGGGRGVLGAGCLRRGGCRRTRRTRPRELSVSRGAHAHCGSSLPLCTRV